MRWHADRYWVEAAEVASAFSQRHSHLFGPPEFVPFVERMLPLEYSECCDDVTFFVCVKDDVDMLSSRVIARLDEFTCVFASSVFVAFSSLPEDRERRASSEAIDRHLPSFFSRVDDLRSGRPLRRSLIYARSPHREFNAPAGRRVLVVNANGMGNFGDDLLAHATARLCLEVMPEAQVVVADPSLDRSLIAAADHIVFGGGGVLYEFTRSSILADLRNISNYFKFGYYAREYGSTFTMLGLGHQQPYERLITAAAPRFIRGALQSASAVSTRDRKTTALLNALIGDVCRVETLEDLAFSYLVIREPREGPVRRVSLAGWRIARHAGFVPLVQFLHKKGCSLRLIVQANEDPGLVTRFRSECAGIPFEALDIRALPIDEGIARLGDTDALITSRFHSFVMGLAAGVPVLAIDQPTGKSHRLTERLFGDKAERILSLMSDGPERLVALAAILVSGEGPRADASVLNAIRKTARQNADVLRSAWQPPLRAGQSHPTADYVLG